ncbi:complex I 51 kDa subunit family protein [Desulfovibrio inopinatus]|uniref:complex I 51 kDa subunit family protein n=1 Tax=Desulfovibrio inopinatus TaxID=102109 RepID=UPI000401225C|nr:NADH-ubiquinone oxidoreductase-F iron-sulfur binding region domain-containing protein [Desulfovibrio inopinatus]
MPELVLLKNQKPGRAATLEEYRASGGYEGLKRALNSLAPKELITMVLDSGLRGRGGAGFPTGRKWSFLKDDAPHPRYIQLNTDEMEPGTFKDRILVNTDPHLVIEGVILTGYAIQAQEGVFFIRPSYEADAVLLETSLQEARDAGYLGKNILGSDFSFDIIVHRSAGRYICGEATAQANAIMGRRPNPDKTSHMIASGLWGQPTVVNNVETLAFVPHIVRNGVEWFKELAATPGGDGTKLYCVSGKVAKPGCIEMPMGTTLGEIIFEQAGGMLHGAEFKACLPGGASTGFLRGNHLSLPLDFESMKGAGQRLGTGSIIVFDKKTCLVQATINILSYFARESCGWCTPCREGLPLMLQVLKKIESGQATPDDMQTLRIMAAQMRHAYCGLAEGAAAPVLGLLDEFSDEVRDHLNGKGCPFTRDGSFPKPGAWNDRSVKTERRGP